MYQPPHFIETDPQRMAALMRGYSFATVVSHDGTAPFATHLPVLHHAEEGPYGTLVTHMARANPQWKQFADGREVLVIFHGPHAYISPNWYENQPEVPTWNYAVVHAYGVPRLVEGKERLRSLLRELVDTFEAGQPQPYGGLLPDEYIDKLSPGIVGLEIPITRVEAKFKLNQNRSAADQAGVIAALAASEDQTEREVAELMQHNQREIR
jgi:transcriptional regulator